MSYTTQQIQSMVSAEALRQGVDPALALAVASAESGFNPDAISPAGAQGVMQLMPATASWLGVSNPLDPAANIRGGVSYLKRLGAKYSDPRRVLAAYNFGPGNVDRGRTWPTETRNYVDRVMGSWNAYGSTGPSTGPPAGSSTGSPVSTTGSNWWDNLTPSTGSGVQLAGMGIATSLLLLLALAGFLLMRR